LLALDHRRGKLDTKGLSASALVMLHDVSRNIPPQFVNGNGGAKYKEPAFSKGSIAQRERRQTEKAIAQLGAEHINCGAVILPSPADAPMIGQKRLDFDNMTLEELKAIKDAIVNRLGRASRATKSLAKLAAYRELLHSYRAEAKSLIECIDQAEADIKAGKAVDLAELGITGTHCRMELFKKHMRRMTRKQSKPEAAPAPPMPTETTTIPFKKPPLSLATINPRASKAQRERREREKANVKG
jgi:hypothetical protein